MENQSIREYASRFGFGPTLERLEEAIVRAGMSIFGRIDHADAARKAGLQMPPTTVLIYGNPRGGTPLMLAAPLAALDLPLRVLVRENADRSTSIAFRPAAPLLRAAGVPDGLATRLDAAQRLLVEAIEYDAAPIRGTAR